MNPGRAPSDYGLDHLAQANSFVDGHQDRPSDGHEAGAMAITDSARIRRSPRRGTCSERRFRRSPETDLANHGSAHSALICHAAPKRIKTGSARKIVRVIAGGSFALPETSRAQALAGKRWRHGAHHQPQPVPPAPGAAFPRKRGGQFPLPARSRKPGHALQDRKAARRRLTWRAAAARIPRSPATPPPGAS